jgi:hypothetical protein
VLKRAFDNKVCTAAFINADPPIRLLVRHFPVYSGCKERKAGQGCKSSISTLAHQHISLPYSLIFSCGSQGALFFSD